MCWDSDHCWPFLLILYDASNEMGVVQFAPFENYQIILVEKMKNEAKTGIRREQGGNEEMMHCDAFLLCSYCKSWV